jgi:phosphoribosyl-AMP cyclohydrolase
MSSIPFHPRRSIDQIEEGCALAAKCGADGLVPCVTNDAISHEVLMLGWMNADALRRTLETREAHSVSRSRQEMWRKGIISGLVEKVVDARIDDDQDAIWLRVEVAGSGASHHVGYRSCFYRAIPTGEDAGGALTFKESRKAFDPVATYGDAPEPTLL